MSSSRKSSGAPVSLFSFQDIITSISGIMILIVLLFALKVAQIEDVPTDPDQNPDMSETIQELAQTHDDLLKNQGGDPVLVEILDGLKVRGNGLKTRIRGLGVERGDLATVSMEKQGTIDNLIAELKSQEGAVRVVFLEGEGSRTPVLLECSNTGIRCGQAGGAAREFATGNLSALHSHIMTSYPPARFSLVFMLRPSSADYSNAVIQWAKGKGYLVGWDAMEEDSHILFGGGGT
jgi:hypothetical protein